MVRLPRTWQRYYDTCTLNFQPGTLTAPARTVSAQHGWRFWHVDSKGLLWPPFVSLVGFPTHRVDWANEPLPVDGVAVARCPHGRTPAAPECDCGVYFWPHAADMYRAVRMFGLVGDVRKVITFGTVAGPFQTDTTFKGMDHVDLFRGLRCHTYRALCAITTVECAMQWGYDIALEPYGAGVPFPDLSQIEKTYTA